MTAAEVSVDFLTVESIGAWSPAHQDQLGYSNDFTGSPGIPDGPVEVRCTDCRKVRTTRRSARWVKLRCSSCRSATFHQQVDAQAVLRACRYLEQLLILVTDTIGYTDDGTGHRASVNLYVDDAGVTTKRSVVIRGLMPMTERLAALRWAWKACGYVYDVRYVGVASGDLCSWDVPMAYDAAKEGGYHLGACFD